MSAGDAAPFAAEWSHAGEITHVFTHFKLRLSVWHALTSERPIEGGRWESGLGEKALPSVMKKAISKAIPDAFKRSPHDR